MKTNDIILLGAGFAAGRLSNKMQAGPIGAVRKKGPRAIYNSFFEKFKRSGNIGNLVKTKAGDFTFFAEFDNLSEAESGKSFLKKQGATIVENSLNKKSFLVRF